MNDHTEKLLRERNKLAEESLAETLGNFPGTVFKKYGVAESFVEENETVERYVYA